MEIVYADDSQFLAHHGILGMKWGIRRYQNKDGSLTEAGKKRYVKSFENIEYPEYYSIGNNKKDRALADTFRLGSQWNISKSDWTKLNSGNEEDVRAIAEKNTRQMLGDVLYNTKISDLSPRSRQMTYGEFEVEQYLNATRSAKKEKYYEKVQELNSKKDKEFAKLSDTVDRLDREYMNIAEDDFSPYDDEYKSKLHEADEKLQAAKKALRVYVNSKL